MTTTHTRTKFGTAAVGAAIAGAAASALLFLGAGTAQAIQDSTEGRPGDAMTTPDPGSTVGVGDAEDRRFNPQPDPPGFHDEENVGDEENFGDDVDYGDEENLEP